MRKPLLGLLVVAGCATAASRPPLLAPGWRPPPGQSCSRDEEDLPGPGLGALADSAGLERALAPLLPQGGYAVLEVSFDSTGALRSETAVVESDLHAATAERVAAAARPHLRLEPARRASASALLRVDGGEPVRFRVGPYEECRPALRNRAEVVRLLEDAAARYPRQPGSHYTAVLWLQLDSAGAVTDRKPQRLTGDPELDEAALRVVEAMRFHPALLNRRVVPVWIQMPVSFAFPVDTAQAGPPPRP